MMRVLQRKSEIAEARRILKSRGLSFTGSRLDAIKRRLGISAGIAIGDERKSWDILLTADFITREVQKSEPILDLGSYGSEMVLVLDALGYVDITAIDLNPDLSEMPRADRIRYKIGDFMETGFPDGSFRAVTAISTIEHGLEPIRLLREMSRLLKPGGIFTASFDYWPQKIDTTGVSLFDLDWLILSADNARAFVDQAAKLRLIPMGNLSFDSGERAISFEGRSYTFAWLALQKTA